MIQTITQFFVVCFILFFSVACVNKESPAVTEKLDTVYKPYSIQIGASRETRIAEEYLIKLKSQIADTLLSAELILDSTNQKYFVKISSFETALIAGEIAFKLHCDLLINQYSIIKEGKKVFDEFANVTFVGWYLDRPSLYNFNIITKKVKLVWHKWGRKILNLYPSQDKRHYFFTTAQTYGKKGGFSYITNARLYLFNRITEQVELKEKYGKGIQLYSIWNDDNELKTHFTILDSILTSTLIQKIYTYDLSGQKINEEERIFELLQEGIPLPPKPAIKFKSPNKNYTLFTKSEKDQNEFYLGDDSLNSIDLILSTDESLYNAAWWNDNKYLIFTTNNFESLTSIRQTQFNSNLYIVSTMNKSIQKQFNGDGIKNFMIHGNLVIFNDGFKSMAKLKFYNYVNDTMYYTLSHLGGCGLNNIPEIIN